MLFHELFMRHKFTVDESQRLFAEGISHGLQQHNTAEDFKLHPPVIEREPYLKIGSYKTYPLYVKIQGDQVIFYTDRIKFNSYWVAREYATKPAVVQSYESVKKRREYWLYPSDRASTTLEYNHLYLNLLKMMKSYAKAVKMYSNRSELSKSEAEKQAAERNK